MKLRYISSAITLALLLTTLPAWADDGDDQAESFACADSVNVMDCIEKTKKNAPVAAAPEEIPLSTQQLGLYGPVSVNVRYDTVLGWIPELNFVQMFYDNGISLQLGYGANEQRANITLGHAFTPNQQIKLTYEYLAQNLPFDFASGTANEWVNQNAFGAAYRFLFLNQTLRSIDLNGYYIHANNKDLSNDIFYQDNDALLNLRRIAGGTEETVTTGVTLAPLRQLLINVGGGYSHLVYDTEYEDNQDTTTLAYNAGLDLLITSRTKLGASIANSAAETDSSVKISQILPAHIEAAVTGQYSQGQAGQPNSTSIMLGLAYPVTTYATAPEDTLGNLKTWIEKPVIRAPRVLAIKDEKVIKYSISASNPPAQSVLTGQMIETLHTQDIFSFDPTMYDKVVYSLSLANNNNNLSDPQNQLYITVQPDNNSPYTATIYSTAPLPNSATPNGGQTVYHLIITALGYKNGLITPIQSQADLELDVNFNKDNEPQWDKSKNKGAILFDQTNDTAGINLNSYLSQSQTSEEPEFYFDASQYPNWKIVEISGTWYLTRAISNNTYNASDVNTTPPIIVYVKFKDDPANIPPDSANSQTLNITVNPDNGIIMQWSNATNCQINTLHAIQPYSTNPAQDITLFDNNDPANQCVTYIVNGAPAIIKDKDDAMISPTTAQSSYTGGVIINGNKMTINNPMPADIGKTWEITVDATPKAIGVKKSVKESNGDNIKFNVEGTLRVNADASNTGKLSDGNYYYAALYVKNLENVSYHLLDSSVNNPYPVTNPFVCPGHVTQPDSTCMKYVDTQKITTENGEATILWVYAATATPTTINWVTLTK